MDGWYVPERQDAEGDAAGTNLDQRVQVIRKDLTYTQSLNPQIRRLCFTSFPESHLPGSERQ